MTVSAGDIQVLLKLVDEYSGPLKQVAGETQSAASGIHLSLGSIIETAAGFEAVHQAFDLAKEGLSSLAEEATNAQEVAAQTEAVLRSTGGAAGVTASQVEGLASSLSHMTTYSDDQIQSMENLELTFTNINSSIFPQTTQVILDMATAMHEDLQSAAIQVGKALQDPVLGMTALRRVGVDFDADQQKVIKDLVDTGQTAQAQGLILSELQREFGGSAAALANTAGGQWQQFLNRIKQVEEEIGLKAMPLVEGELSKVNAYFDSEAGQQWIENLTTGAEHFVEKADAFIQADGPKIVDDLEHAATAAESLASNMGTVAGKIADISTHLSSQQWQALLGAGAGFAAAGPEGAVAGGAAAYVAGQTQKIEKQNPGQSTLASVGSAIGSDLPDFMGVNGSQVAKGIEEVSTALGHLKDGVDGVQASTIGADNAWTKYVDTQERFNINAADTEKLVDQVRQRQDAYRQSLQDSQLALLADQNGISDFQRDQEQAVHGIDEMSASLYAQIQADSQAVVATNAVQSALGQLHDTYETGLGLIKVYSQANSEYSTEQKAITDAVTAIQEKQKEGIPLTAQEIDLLNSKDELIGRLTGGIRDNTIQSGEAAAANVELMKAQDTLNGLLRDGITSGKDYDAAVQAVQTSTDKARQFGLDPATDAAGQFNQGLAGLQGVIVGTLVPAIQTLAQDLNNLKAPPPIEIQIADAAAIAEIDRIKGIISQGATLPVSIVSSGGVNPTANFYTGTGPGGVPHTMLARVGELGPELAIYPYAGAYAAGGTVGMLNDGYALLPKGTQILPADQTAQLTNASSIFSAMAETLGGDAQRMPEFLSRVEGYVKQYGTAILQDWVDLANSLQSQVDEAWAKGDSETQAKAQKQLDGVKQLMSDYARDTGSSMQDAIASAAADKSTQQYVTDSWNETLSQFSNIISGQYQKQVQSDLDLTNKELAALGDQLPPEIAAKLKQHAADDEADLAAAGKIMGDLISKHLVEQITPLQSTEGGLLGNLTSAVAPDALQKAQDKLKQDQQALSIGLQLHLDQSDLDKLQQQVEADKDQLEAIGQIQAQYTADGYQIGMGKLTDDQLKQLDDLVASSKDHGVQFVDSIVQAVEDGRLPASDAIHHMTQPMLDQLKTLQDQWQTKYTEAVLTGDQAAADAAQHGLKAVNDVLAQQGQILSSNIGMLQTLTGELTNPALWQGPATQALGGLPSALFAGAQGGGVPGRPGATGVGLTSGNQQFNLYDPNTGQRVSVYADQFGNLYSASGQLIDPSTLPANIASAASLIQLQAAQQGGAFDDGLRNVLHSVYSADQLAGSAFGRAGGFGARTDPTQLIRQAFNAYQSLTGGDAEMFYNFLSDPSEQAASGYANLTTGANAALIQRAIGYDPAAAKLQQQQQQDAAAAATVQQTQTLGGKLDTVATKLDQLGQTIVATGDKVAAATGNTAASNARAFAHLLG